LTNAKGIPPYYYQKPEVTSAANGGGAQQNKRAKRDGPAQGEGIAKNGCALCGKKRHMKNNDCPNNPNFVKE